MPLENRFHIFAPLCNILYILPGYHAYLARYLGFTALNVKSFLKSQSYLQNRKADQQNYCLLQLHIEHFPQPME